MNEDEFDQLDIEGKQWAEAMAAAPESERRKLDEYLEKTGLLDKLAAINAELDKIIKNNNLPPLDN